MRSPSEPDTPTALYHAVVGKMVLEHMERVHPTVISQAVENRAVQCSATGFLRNPDRINEKKQPRS